MAGKQEILEKIRDTVASFDIDNIQAVCLEALKSGVPAYRIVAEGLSKGMEIVGQRYERCEYFLSELITAGETMKEGMRVIEPHLRKGDVKSLGKAVVGTAAGDLHEIGKNIFVTLLSAAGFDVTDLGSDVSAESFVAAIRENSPEIVGISALLTTTMVEMGNVIDELERAGLRKGIKIILGGAPVTEEYAKRIGADAAVTDAVEGVELAKTWVHDT